MGNGNPAEPERIVIIRPGALGDVLVTRGALAWAKRRFPDRELVLLAPGERGRFLVRPGLADSAYDWDRAAFAWLFTDGETPPPPDVAAAFAGARIVVAFVNFPATDGAAAETEARAFSGRLREAAPAAQVCVFGAAPPGGERVNIYEWLLAGVRGAAGRAFPASALQPEMPLRAIPRIPVGTAGAAADLPGRYAVLHPGSGGARKNWPLVNFAYLGRRLLANGLDVVVTAGPADGQLGEELCGALPGARLATSLTLPQLAGVLAGAALYVGNDSGVSHLAAAVAGPDGRFPISFVIFGPTDSAVWAPIGSNILAAGQDFSRLDGAAAWKAVRSALPGATT